MTEKQYIKNINKTAKEISKLNSSNLDLEVEHLKKAFDIAYENKLFSIYLFDKKTQDKLKLKFFSKLTQYSGSLSFLAIQIFAANAIMNKNNFHRKEMFFNKKSGIAINHLRANTTLVSAKKVNDGYLLNGVLTWASGYKIFNTLLIGFHFENKEYEVMAKFEETKGFKIINTPKTFVGQSLNTVNIKLKNFFVKEKNIVSSNDIGNYTKNKSLSKTIHYTFYALGKATLKNIKDKELKEFSRKQLKKQKNMFLKSNDGKELDTLRIELFNTVQSMITTTMIQNGGKSILLESKLQKYYRELIMFNSNGLNSNIKNLFKQDYLSK